VGSRSRGCGELPTVDTWVDALFTAGSSLSYSGRSEPGRFTASMVLGYSRMLFFQHYPQFTRFICKVFNTEALQYFDGACGRCMIDNTHVVVLSGTGKDMVPAPRWLPSPTDSARVACPREGRRQPFGTRRAPVRPHRRQLPGRRNSLTGRPQPAGTHLVRQGQRHLQTASARQPRELFATERLHLRPLPAWVPEVYLLHQRSSIRGLRSRQSHPLLGSLAVHRPPARSA